MTGNGSANAAAGSRRWRDVLAAADLELDKMVGVNVGRYSILLVRTSEGVSALQNVCPHEHCYLDQGVFDGNEVTCAGHGWRFDARTGEGIRPRRARLGRFDVRIQEGRILVALP